MFFKSSSRIVVLSLLLAALAWILDAWLSSLLFPDASFVELLRGDFPERTIYVRSVFVAILFIFGLYAGTLVSKLEAKHEAKSIRQNVSHSHREEELKKINQESLGSMAGGFAHEFNNILQAIMGSAYIADLQSGGGKSPLHPHLNDIQQSGARAARLCDQMLTFAGKKSILMKDLFVDKQLLALEPELVALTGDTPVQFNLKAPGVTISGDARLFKNLLFNTLKNAVEAAGSHFNSVQIATSSVSLNEEDLLSVMSAVPLKPGPYIRISVQDSGAGISANVLEKMFDPFFTTKFQGRGLGLSEAMGIVRTFAGGLKIQTVLNAGTTVTYFFPAQKPAAASGQKSSSIPNVTGHGLIWIVDDELLILQTLQRVLSRWGFEVHTATSGEEFLDNFENTADACSCVLLDMIMPEINGVDVHASLRKTHPNIPVVIMSGYTEEQSLEKFDLDQIAGFIHKPFSLESLEIIFQKVLPPDAWSK